MAQPPRLRLQRPRACLDVIRQQYLTYIRTGEGWLYLAAILDLFSRKIVGWAMADGMPQELTLAALRMAITRQRPGPGLIHHSDRGGSTPPPPTAQRSPRAVLAAR